MKRALFLLAAVTLSLPLLRASEKAPNVVDPEPIAEPVIKNWADNSLRKQILNAIA